MIHRSFVGALAALLVLHGVLSTTYQTLVRFQGSTSRPFLERTLADLDRLGPVTHIVAPNAFHHLFAAERKAAHPDAVLHAPEALRRKRPDLAIVDYRLPEGHTGIEALAALRARWPRQALPAMQPSENLRS